MLCVSNMLKYYSREEYKMQNSSPDTDPTGSSILYNDSGYFTNHNPDPQSYSSNSNSEPSFEVVEEISLHSRHGECLPTLQSTSGVYFCEDAVFDEPKLEGPPLLCDNTNNYEHFSSLIKFSLEEASGNYLTNDANLNSLASLQDSSNSEYYNNVQTTSHTNVLQYFDQDSLSSLSSINPSQPICVSEVANKQSIVSQAVEQCLTVSASQNKSDIEVISISTKEQLGCSANVNNNNSTITSDNSNKTINTPACSNVNLTPTKLYINPVNPDLSPELFSEEDEPITEVETSLTNISQSQKHLSPNEQFLRNDRKLLKRIQETLSGVPPPPSLTILQLSVSEMLEKINNNKQLFLSAKCDDTVSKSAENKSVKSLLVSSTKEEVDCSEWPEITNYRYHGLYYNRALVSEQIEQHCVRYLTRYVGAETASSCTAWSHTAPGSASKRRTARLRWAAKSPGRRLSHLARRRITFSSANLTQAKQSVVGSSSSSSTSRQLMIDPRKNVSFNKRRSPRKSPWKKSPRKSPQKRVKTPNSSAKKRSARRLALPGDSSPKPGSSKVSSTKRALFQSPEHSRSTISSSDSTTQQLQQRNKSKRALFMSPTKREHGDKKRKRMEEDTGGPSKFPRSMSFDVQHSSALQAAAGGAALQRRNSEIIVRPSEGRGELSNLHKQKMLWAVSEALRAQQINMSHPQFRGFASVLCKVIKHLVPDLMSNGPRQPGSTSDRMLRIARQHSYAVTRGKSFEDIMQQVKDTNANRKNLKPPSGYVAPESTRSQQAKNVLQDKVMNIETNTTRSVTKSPLEKKAESGFDDSNKLRSIRRQIIFDDNEISKSCNTNR